MGLYVQSLENLPADANRDYYVYLLDYGWSEPIGEALQKNFERMAEMAESSNSVVITSRNRVHFEDQVLSWHHINGENAEEILPAILITNRNPHRFREMYSISTEDKIEKDLKLVLIPLKRFCSTTTQVVELIERLFNDIKAGKELSEFRIGKKVHKGGGAPADALILERSKNNNGIRMKDVINYLKDIDDDGHPSSGKISKTVHPIHFEDFSGQQFERLVFAFLSRQKSWDKIQWLGETGSDNGRDIWGEIDKKTYCYQCANYQKLPFKKISDDIDKLVKANTRPDHYIVVCSSAVSADKRIKISAYASRSGIQAVEVWSGIELEEKLRQHTPELLKRFVDGESFPDSPNQLVQAANQIDAENDQDILEIIAECFDRPAFTTHFHDESNIPNFEKAITDTIEVLNTGMHRLRDGTLIRKIPSRHQVKDTYLKEELAAVTQLVILLRDTFIRLKNDKEIRSCGCGDANCPVWMLSDRACAEMDGIRKNIFTKFKSIHSSFHLQLS